MTYKTDLATKQAEALYKRNIRANMRPVQKPLHVCRQSYTVVTELEVGDIVLLGKFGDNSIEVMPELSRIKTTGVGTVQLVKVDKDGTSTNISATAAVNNNTVVFARLAGGLVPVAGTDDIGLKVTVVSDFAAAKTLEVELVYATGEGV